MRLLRVTWAWIAFLLGSSCASSRTKSFPSIAQPTNTIRTTHHAPSKRQTLFNIIRLQFGGGRPSCKCRRCVYRWISKCRHRCRHRYPRRVCKWACRIICVAQTPERESRGSRGFTVVRKVSLTGALAPIRDVLPRRGSILTARSAAAHRGTWRRGQWWRRPARGSAS